MMGVGKKVKKEVGFMKKGAKILAKRGKGWVKGKFEEAKERAKIQRELDREAKKAEEAAYQEAYREQLIEEAKKKGRERAKKKTGSKGVLRQLGELGDAMSISSMMGLDEKKTEKPMSTSDYMFSGFGEKKKQKPPLSFQKKKKKRNDIW